MDSVEVSEQVISAVPAPATPPDSAGAPIVVRDPLADLLRDYVTVLSRADRLPVVLWSRTRVPGTSPLARVWRLPRLTVGTSHLVLFHVTRSVEALLRTYAARAALGELDDAGLRQREMLLTFSGALKRVRWWWFVAAGISSTIVLAQATLAFYASGAFSGLQQALDEERVAVAFEVLGHIGSVSTSPAALVSLDPVTGFRRLGLLGLLVLTAVLLLATVCVLRPVTTAFRVKRMLFNLAGQPDDAIHRTTTTWHVPRTTGIYDRERQVYSGVGVVAAKEKPFDLVVSGLFAVLAGALVVTIDLADPDLQLEALLTDAGIVAVLVGLRASWLFVTHRDRCRPVRKSQLPEAAVLPVSGRAVDRRRPIEAFSVALILAPVEWYRMSRQLSDIESEARLQRGLGRRRGGRIGSVLAAVLILIGWWIGVVAPLLGYRALRLRRLVGRERRHRALLLLTVAAAATVPATVAVYALSIESTGWNIAFFSHVMLLALAVGATQAVQNGLVRAYAAPLPFGMVGPAPATPLRLNLPPTWPAPPPGWQPPAGWRPDPAWGPAPKGWRLWVPAQAG